MKGGRKHMLDWMQGGLGSAALLRKAETRSISAENPDGAKGGGAKAKPGDDENCTPHASELGKGWKVRPCIRLAAGAKVTLADIKGPGIVQHMWFTVHPDSLRTLALRVFYEGMEQAAIETPLHDFFCNGADGLAQVNSQAMCVNPRGGMNCYWPMPFRKRCRIEVSNDGPKDVGELFYQITYALAEVPKEAGYLHAQWRRSMTTRGNPEHVILADVRGRGQYVGTYLVWNQLSNQWWGEGEVKFWIDGDWDEKKKSAIERHPTICGTGTEDYFGGAWGFRAAANPDTSGPVTYSTAFMGYPQALVGDGKNERVPCHSLYRWHVPDPICFKKDLRVAVQALGWYPTRKFQPLTDDIASVAYWYQEKPAAGGFPGLPALNERLPR